MKGYQAAHSRMDNSIVADDGNHGTAKEKYLDEWTKDIVGWKEPKHSMHKDYYQKLKLRQQNTFVHKSADTPDQFQYKTPIKSS